MSDGAYNIVDHPQNFQPRDLTDAQILRNSTGNEDFSFANCDFVIATLADEDGQLLLTEPSGDKLTATLTKIQFNSFRKIV